MTFIIHCSICNKELGESDKEQGRAQNCTPCAQAEQLEFSLLHGKISNHDDITDDKLTKVLQRVAIRDKEVLKNRAFGARITKALKENTIL